MRGPRALEMLKASREGSCPQGVPRQPLTHKRAPEVGTSGLLPASAPSGLWHPSRAILPRRTMETERRHATGAACAPLGRGRVPCSRSSAGPVHLCKTQSCRAWPCSVRLPASLGAVCGCVDARSSRVGARGRREAPQGAPRTRNERLHPHAAPRPSAPASFLRAATSHTYARGLPILSTRFPISTTRTRLALRTRSTAHELPGQRFEQSQAKAAREQQELVLSKVTQRSAARGEHPRPTLFSVSSCGLSVTSAGPAARASAHARTHARTLAAACPPRVRLRPPCAAPSLAASRSRAAVPRPPEGAMGVCVSAPRRGCAAGLEGAAALCPDATSGSSDQLAPEWVLTS